MKSDAVKTGVAEVVLGRIARHVTAVPDGFHIHRTLERILDRKRKAYDEEAAVDWAFAESLAWGSLLLEGLPRKRDDGHDHHQRLAQRRRGGRPDRPGIDDQLRRAAAVRLAAPAPPFRRRRHRRKKWISLARRARPPQAVPGRDIAGR